MPWLKFFTGDWLKDPNVTMLSPAARGVWIDLLCAMHEAGRYGELCGTTDQLARIARCSTAELVQALADIETTGVADVTLSNNTTKIVNRRMLREYKQREDAAKRQRKFRDNGGGDPDRWTFIRAGILLLDNKRCAYCGRRAASVDHVIPRKRGGDESENNLVACCKLCNSIKNNRTPQEAKMTFHASFIRLDINSFSGSNAPSNNGVTGYISEVRDQKSEKEEKSNGASAPPSFKKIDEKGFYDEIAQFKETYTKPMLREFFDYWKEKSATGIMRFQLQKTWDTALRLKTWARRNKEFPSKKPEPAVGPPLQTL